MFMWLLIIFLLLIMLFLYCSLVLAKEADEYMEDEMKRREKSM